MGPATASTVPGDGLTLLEVQRVRSYPRISRSTVTRPVGTRVALAEECVARIPSAFRSRKCGVRSVGLLAGIVPLCVEHLQVVRGTVPNAWRRSLDHVAPVSVQPKRDDPRATRVVYVNTTGPGVVYYIGDPPSQRVKIGTSTKLPQRFTDIRKKFPGAVLLAVEPGHFELEQARHAQFPGLRCIQRGEREWFRKAPELMEHVNSVRREHGDPARYLS